nr:MAG TPA: hypothetical protein [Crassvirales sp.]
MFTETVLKTILYLIDFAVQLLLFMVDFLRIVKVIV